MDQTLAQILSLLFETQIALQKAQQEVAQLRQVIDSKLPVQNGPLDDLKGAEVVSGNRA